MAKKKAQGAKAQPVSNLPEQRRPQDIPYRELDAIGKLQRDFAALELRKSGLQWHTIAEHLKYLDHKGKINPDQVRQNVWRMVNGAKREATEEFIELQSQRYEMIYSTGIQRFLANGNGGDRAGVIALKALDRLSYLQGLNPEAIISARGRRHASASTGALMPREAYSEYSSADDLDTADEILDAEYKMLSEGADLEGLDDLTDD